LMAEACWTTNPNNNLPGAGPNGSCSANSATQTCTGNFTKTLTTNYNSCDPVANGQAKCTQPVRVNQQQQTAPCVYDVNTVGGCKPGAWANANLVATAQFADSATGAECPKKKGGGGGTQ
jgi:hypothetical protein